MHKTLHGHQSQSAAGVGGAHTEEAFSFVANGPIEEVGPLFAAYKERVWAPKFDPQFVYPLPAADVEGMVFTTAHNDMRAVWVNTKLNLKNGDVQYVYLVPDALLTVITIKLTPDGQKTNVHVDYQRTALSVDANERVRHMAAGDRRAGADWDKWINGYLQTVSSR